MLQASPTCRGIRALPKYARTKTRAYAPLARRTGGGGANWRDECPLEERANAAGVTLQEHARKKDEAHMRANRKTVHYKEERYLRNLPVLPPSPASPPIAEPEERRVGADRAPSFARLTGECSTGTCVACMETRLNANYWTP